MHEILTNGQMAAADRFTIAGGTAGITLMEAAGRAVADVVAACYPGRRILILCGPGNNGGDGFVAGRHLKDRGFEVDMACLTDAGTLKGDAARAAGKWDGKTQSFEEVPIPENAVVLDAVFGTGFDRALESPVTDLFQKIKEAKLPVVAVDIPSGVNGDTGAGDPHALQAAYSVTFFRKKLGHVLYPGAGFSGQVSVHDIGISDAALAETGFAALENHPGLWKAHLPHPAADTHKYKKGHVVMMGGAAMTGAVRLASEAAMRVGAGLCSVVAPPGTGEIYRKGAAHILIEDGQGYGGFAAHCRDERRSAVLIGPGAGLKDKAGLQKAVLDVLALEKPCVLDADALSAFEGEADVLFEALHSRCVLTPHEGEFKRVFGGLDGSKLERCQKAAKMAGCAVLLKGPDTVICAPDRTVVINSNSVPALGTAGSGDVLAGMIAGYLAQGVGAFDAACMSVWIHARAGAHFGEGLVASDLPNEIPLVLKAL